MSYFNSCIKQIDPCFNNSRPKCLSICIQNSVYQNSASHQRASNKKKNLQTNLILNPDYEEQV